MQKLCFYNVRVLLVQEHQLKEHALLKSTVLESLPDLEIVALPRKEFQATQGAKYMEEYAMSKSDSIEDRSPSDKKALLAAQADPGYFALSALSALVSHLTAQSAFSFRKQSLLFEIRSGEGFMFIGTLNTAYKRRCKEMMERSKMP